MTTALARIIGSELGAEAPEWIELIPAGAFTLRDGRGTFRLGDPAQVIARSFEMAGDSKILVDIDHGADTKGGSSEAAGWITQMEVREGAIWGRVEWTELGRAKIEGQLYRRISPVFAHQKGKTDVEFIVRAALVNNPAIAELTALAASQETEEIMDLTEPSLPHGTATTSSPEPWS